MRPTAPCQKLTAARHIQVPFAAIKPGFFQPTLSLCGDKKYQNSSHRSDKIKLHMQSQHYNKQVSKLLLHIVYPPLPTSGHTGQGYAEVGVSQTSRMHFNKIDAGLLLNQSPVRFLDTLAARCHKVTIPAFWKNSSNGKFLKDLLK